jgi:ankyrin repeat protein
MYYFLKVNKADKLGKTALHKATEEGNKITTNLLISHPDIDINAQDSLGQTALHIVVIEDMIDIVHQYLRIILATLLWMLPISWTFNLLWNYS